MSQIILASASPRRRELLEQVGISFHVCPAQGEECISEELPQEVVMSLSRQKAREVASGIATYNEMQKEITTPQDILVIGADTVVAYGDVILGKPADEEDAVRMLSLLEGKTHSVYTGVTFIFLEAGGRTGQYSFYEKTDVTMYPMSKEQIRRYVATGEPMDKAGAYAIQGKCAIYVEKIDGDYNNVVGLPVARVYQELTRLGFDPYGEEN